MTNKKKYFRIMAHLFFRTNIIKTIFINFKMLSFFDAIKLPLIIYGKVRFADLSGKIIFQDRIKHKMVFIGLNTDGYAFSTGSLIKISGTIIFNGPALFGANNTIEVTKNSTLMIGEGCATGNGVKLRCWNKISIGRLTRIASECQIFDTNFHHLKSTIDGKVFRSDGEVKIGEYNWIGNRCSIMKNTMTPNWCIVASNSLLNKNYINNIPNDSIIGGNPVRLLKKDIIRIFNFKEDQEIFEYFSNNPQARTYNADLERRELSAKLCEVFPLFD